MAAASLLGIGLLLWSAWCWSGEFVIRELSTQLAEEGYLLDAQVEYRFSVRAVEALENGVPLTLEIQIELRRQNAWIWEQDVLKLRLRYQVRYQALASVYQVRNLQSGSRQNFVTRRAALDALGTLNGVFLIAEDHLLPGDAYQLSLRASLDIESLPLPLRPWAYLDPDWEHDSAWSRWNLQP